MSKETSKALRRRWCEDATGAFPWRSLFVGDGIDVGPGDDPLPFEGVTTFDRAQGDANTLASYFPEARFDYLHASQCLEHMHDPAAALGSWISVVKPGGHVIVTIPSWELYEGMVWPSRWNGDHKSTWSMWQKGSPAPFHVLVPEFLKGFPCKVKLCRLVDANYDYKVGATRDQTWEEAHGVEAFIEFVLQKPKQRRK